MFVDWDARKAMNAGEFGGEGLGGTLIDSHTDSRMQNGYEIICREMV